MNKKLGRLIIRQHAPLLVGILILFMTLGAWSGWEMNQHWQMLDQNHDMVTSRLEYDSQRHQYQDADGVQAQSKQQYLTRYLQVYQDNRRGLLANSQVGSHLESNGFVWAISLLIGVALVAVPRHRHWNEWLQGLGFGRARIFSRTFLIYSLTTSIATILAKLMILSVLVNNIPGTYFSQFNWWIWSSNLISTVLVALILMTISALVMLVTPNIVIVLIIGYAATRTVSRFVLLQSFGQINNHFLDFLNQHWWLGVGVASAILCLGWLLGRHLSSQLTSDRLHEAILLPAWRLPVLFGLSIILTYLLTNVVLPPQTSWLVGGLVELMILFILITWIYQPRWSRYVWQVVRELR
ncbi:ABC transporter permease [Lactiplantibacillus pentosus]|uniref:ABC transporter permease n=1 Tax=Lactiplantibacillus pentosus TaxID=1589 RepID=UPI00270194EC|nr:ABC transporter permease [Lactiplantibacillus pentosus]MDO7805683.1 ABC transporter permease [Lactiplantibacillus pentosus]